jgi:hypothetical protein
LKSPRPGASIAASERNDVVSIRLAKKVRLMLTVDREVALVESEPVWDVDIGPVDGEAGGIGGAKGVDMT